MSLEKYCRKTVWCTGMVYCGGFPSLIKYIHKLFNRKGLYEIKQAVQALSVSEPDRVNNNIII